MAKNKPREYYCPIREGNNSTSQSKNSNMKPINYYLSEDYETYFIEYIGDINKSFKNIDYAVIVPTNSFFALVFVQNGKVNDLINDVPEIINIQKSYPYTLSDMKIVDEDKKFNVIDKGRVDYTGIGVIVGIISTGIDYLNPRFMKEDGSTRIVRIWDQTLQSESSEKELGYGTVFSEDEINKAIVEQKIGMDPYNVVFHKDESGYGTAIAGIIGGRKLESSDPLVSVAPTCEYAIVKLKEAKRNTLKVNGIEDTQENVYESTDIGGAVEFLANLQIELNKPMVVYVALGTNFGGHAGDGVLERFIDFKTQSRTYNIVTSTGDQGNSDTHASGYLEKSGDRKKILLEVEGSERNLSFSIYLRKPDIISVSITLPNGSTTERIPVPQNLAEISKFNIGETEIIVQYFIGSQGSGDQSVDIIINNPIGGNWEITLIGDYVLNGRYDTWLLQRELLQKGTRFVEADPYITLMTPGTSNNIIVTSYYNQMDNSVDLESGRGYTRDGRIKPSSTIGTEGMLTVGLNNNLVIASGAAIAGAILAGVVALIYQWGYVEGNDINLYPQKMKNYLIIGSVKFEGYTYPNQLWGFGALSIEKLFEELNKISSRKTILLDNNSNRISKELYVRLPLKIYE